MVLDGKMAFDSLAYPNFLLLHNDFLKDFFFQSQIQGFEAVSTLLLPVRGLICVSWVGYMNC